MNSEVQSVFSPRRRRVVENNSPSLTQQHFGDECNINTILAKARRTGQMPINHMEGAFMDASNGTMSFHEMQNMVVQAQQNFMAMPSGIRAKFQNAPENLMAFLADENNREEAEKLGLITPQKKEETTNVDPNSTKPIAASN